ncbi:flavin reductase (DIM6/NTAB) family NADH-FMN oxidoreductase RutF [Aquimarina sp. EL_43]|uniref:flavin reductase family protein n=1 Tax=unclassified Aquimarina TaxID=2627091 RepID=UPI0018CBC28A|nr:MULTISPECIES: flavin reductase family protein [unclassified Aquimarina]MBG6131938.1 flavin reductase (DIM6/NTAB) family NADH-FMN oxidoreductase RutF [Aquimarina sp. EL_35]MBG6149502.1 flavin reductase (DIM6/NTAB) family NADH-FMN oxidoreductase RutF [Aquimarina sp. EL_32]MBG6170235.1 flavin reductase (DIM6/NTAB) family NADH-FMN oxidoreductase RutF [Aquimarina sp. EL_43]
MITIDPSEVTTGKLHGLILGAIGPRPIAFASTMDVNGNANLSPFSFFNVFSANPPILIFSPARRVRDNTTKHTLENAKSTKEVVINIVNYDIVQQMSLSSTEYPEGVNEFVKSGLTMVPSEKVKAYRVGESPVQFECKVNQVVPMGTEGGAGNLIICEVVLMHINENVMDENNRIDQHKIDQVARMGGNWYSRANMGMFEVPKPLSSIGIGVDALPEEVRNSTVFTGNDLGKLGNVEGMPTKSEALEFVNNHNDIKDKIQEANLIEIHKFAKQYLDQDDMDTAWNILAAK